MFKKLTASAIVAGATLTAFTTFAHAGNVACTTPVPATPANVTATPGPMKGQITLNWSASTGNIDRYGVSYGYTSGKYLFGARKVGDEKSTSFTVGHLNPGTKYYFSLDAKCGKDGNGPATKATEVSATAK